METPRLLEYLTNDTYLSGEAVAAHLGVSRAAVWKEIEGLRLLGYGVEAVPHKGYRLVRRPDRLYPWEIARRMETEFIGRSVIYHQVIDSTNNHAKSMMANQPEEGTVVVAEAQTAGRGRLGRTWASSEAKGIWMSLILRPQIPLADLSKLTLMAAVATRRAVGDFLGVDARIKWPNDLLLDGRKICGILAELSGEPDRMASLILGIGINVNQSLEDFPEELRGIAGSLRWAAGREIDRIGLLATLLKQLELAYQEVCSEGFSQVLHECRRYSATLGRTVTVRNGRQTLTGFAEAIGDDGGLRLRLDSGEVLTVFSGEVCEENDSNHK